MTRRPGPVAPTFNAFSDPQSVRECYDFLRADYRMSRDGMYGSQLRGAAPNGSGADYHYRYERDWLHMMERSRHYARNDQVIASGLRRLAGWVIGEGFTPDPDTGDAELDRLQRAKWNDWANDPDQCDSEGERTFAEMVAQVFTATIVDGDIFGLPLETGALQLVEAHRCRTPQRTRRNVVHGILLEEGTARRLEYWFTQENLDPYRDLLKVGDMSRIPARNGDGMRQVFHVANLTRSSQRRGVPLVAPVSDTAVMHDDLQFCKLVQQQVQAMVAFIHERQQEQSPKPGGGQEAQKGEQEQQQLGGGYSRLVETVGPSMEVFGKPGETIKGFAPSSSGGEYVPYSRLLLSLLAINLDIPLVCLLMDASETNFSGFRGAIQQGQKSWRQWQRNLATRLLSPVWRWRMRVESLVDAELRGLMENNAAALNHQWHPTPWDYIEPLKDAQADALMESRGLSSRRRILRRRQLDIDAVDRETIADRKRLIERAIEAAEKLGEGVTWRDLLSMPMADRITAATSRSETESTTTTEDV